MPWCCFPIIHRPLICPSVWRAWHWAWSAPLLFAGEAADLAQDLLIGSQVACLGSEGQLMRRRLQQYLAGHLDT